MNNLYRKFKVLIFIAINLVCANSFAQLPSGLVLKDISGGTFTMGSNTLMGSPTQQSAAPEHQVTLSPYSIGETEVTNSQYTEFLNEAYTDGLLEIITGTMGPDNGKRLVQGTASSNFSGKVFYNLDGTRVLKDHDDSDGDANEFTGDVEPENPLNVSYIDFDVTTSLFYVKDPHNATDFNWVDVCNYQDYGTTPMLPTGAILNDFDDWAGAGLNYSNELQYWTIGNPAAAVNLPTQNEVSNWPVTFIRWYGAKAFAEYYELSLPTEAQWEFVAKGGQNFQYAVHDGSDVADANWNAAGMGNLATGHVREAISGTVNPFGVYNLAGNAWEWIEDNYVEPYDIAAVTDPLILEAGSTSRCWRGGSWNYHEATLQSAARFADEENRGNDHFGFRVVGTNSIVGVIENKSDLNISLSPNPATNSISITTNNNSLLTVVGFNTIGKLVYSSTHSNGDLIDISSFEKGIYFFQIEDQTIKILKQ
ncbi:MAG: SUMF1/EgtB/PvdO family nonheme iron enzyme [Crocinitomicaceae bacterium]|nr:SUMF1/EgtB/PvdO family nonheme iron enzyme [Flavobacteriales bacterium]NQZ34040.1 SUMF1/EgtB/PvdO family nonheme iron enzyme [Crocinitomicaceae bacterium]